MPIEQRRYEDIEDTNISTNTGRENPTETPVNDSSENDPSENDDISQDIIDDKTDWDKSIYEDEKVIKTKEDIKELIDKSKNSQELYENAIKVLRNLESNFQQTLFKVAEENDWDLSGDRRRFIRNSRFNYELNTENPATIFEKKWKELLERASTIEGEITVQNAASQIVWEWNLDIPWVNENDKNSLVEELFNTRELAIQEFKADIEDGFLNNDVNIAKEWVIFYWREMWKALFYMKEDDAKKFHETVDWMDLPNLMLSTFNIDDWAWAFTYCYWKLKEKLWNKNLFSFIDEQGKDGEQVSEGLKYSAFKMLFTRRKTADLIQWLDWYNWDKQSLIKFAEKNIKEDDEFKTAFLSSMKELEKTEYFWGIAQDLIENDADIKKANELALNIDNIDVFKTWKVEWFFWYDGRSDWWWATYFDADLKDYTWKKWYKLVSKEDNKEHTKCILKKGNDTITMVKFKNLKMPGQDDNNLGELWIDPKEIEEYKAKLESLMGWKDYNIFSLRGHCYNTQLLAICLWKLNAVWEWDLLIDWGCFGADKTGPYYKNWIKWQICAYTDEGRWNSTQAFIDKIINAKNSWKNFSDVLWYYTSLWDENTRDGYFATYTERPDTVAAQYKKLTQKNDREDFEWLRQDLWNPALSEIQPQDSMSNVDRQENGSL